MRVQLLKPVFLLGEIKKSGIFDVPEASAKHWIATGSAKLASSPAPAVDPPLDPPATVDPPAKGGKKGS